MCAAIAAARHRVWLATYIFHDDPAPRPWPRRWPTPPRRGVRWVWWWTASAASPRCRCVALAGQWRAAGGLPPAGSLVFLAAAGPVAALHQKLCVRRGVAFVGGINVIDDRNDMNHGWQEAPRLDFAVEIRGPVATACTRRRARHVGPRPPGRDWRDEVLTLARSRRAAWPRSAAHAARLKQRRARRRALASLHRCGRPFWCATTCASAVPSSGLHRRHRHARQRWTSLVCPYFYPGRLSAARCGSRALRGVQVRLLLQGKADYRIAAWRRRRCTTSCWPAACACSSTRPPSCTPRWPWSTTTGPPWAAATSTR
jgi:cardiolipin synthase